jgi:glycine oxidase
MANISRKIAVLGAGAMGLSAAYVLARAGHGVVVYDPHGFKGHNASAVAGGMLAPYAEVEHMDARWVRAGFAGIEFWRDFDALDGVDIDFGQAGSLLIAHEQDRYILDRFCEHLERAAPEAGDVRVADSVEPMLAGRFAQGLYIEGEAHLHPAKALAALEEQLRGMGVECFAEAVEPEVLDFDYVIDCRGMAANDADLRGVKGELAIVRNAEFSLSRPVRLMHPRYPLYIVPRADHVFMIGATQIESTGERVALRSAMELLSALYSLHPSFGEAEILSIDSGVRPSYADNLPRIKVRGNVLSCNGLFRHGYLLSPVMAQVVERYVAGAGHEYADLLMSEV